MSRTLRALVATPVYPSVFAAAFVVVQFGSWTAPTEALWRPLVVTTLIVLIAQAVGTLIVRSGRRGAVVGLFVLMFGIDLAIGALGIVASLVFLLVASLRRRRGAATKPLRQATRVLNAIAVTLLVISAGTLWFDGAFAPSRAAERVRTGDPIQGSPDIYLLMLDGYPRADSLARDLDFDNRPFLDEMATLGFDVAENSRANYTMTLLTLASMLNGGQLPAIAPAPPAAVPAQYRLLTRLINDGVELDALQTAGYEIVSIPSEYAEAAVTSADRVLDSGHMTTFELALVLNGAARLLPPVASLAVDQHRARIDATFSALRALSAERSERPKLVFAHVLAPHPPIAFGRAGERPDPLPCPMTSCSPFSFGDEYGDQLAGPMRDQIGWLNDTVVATVRHMGAAGARPPVIIVFSDHGLRIDAADRDEMFRSLFVASTPGMPNLFPDDVTPVNVIPRLRNAYLGAEVPLASEESYWVDPRTAGETGIFPEAEHPAP